MGAIRKQREKLRSLRRRYLHHRRKGREAPRLRKAYQRAKGELARLRRQARQDNARKAVRWARSQVGVKESPPGSNRGPKIDDWQRAHGMLAQPWCGAFVGMALRAGGVRLPNGVVYTPTILAWAKNRQHGLSLTSKPRPGDLVLYKFSNGPAPVEHVGLYIGEGLTIEGNTSSDEQGSQDNGGMVAVRRRRGRGVVAYVRVRYPRSSK
jgi:cell wall-associated NlpC family hydrolase